jgi:hypothetical protein
MLARSTQGTSIFVAARNALLPRERIGRKKLAKKMRSQK